MIKLLSLTILCWSSLSFGTELLQCPPESMRVNHTSPVTHLQKVTCGYMKDGSLVKHGPEMTLEASGKAKNTVYFNHGVEGERPSMAIAPSPTNLPGVEEASQSFLAVQELMKVLAFGKEGLNQGQFKVHQCDPQPKTWVSAALTKKEVKKTYAFKENCDVSGSFTASFLEEFPVGFDLRNLQEFNRTDMMVKMAIKQSVGGIRYRFDVRDGKLSSPNKKVEFKVEYEVDINPLTGSTIFNTQQGTITITKLDGKVVSITKPLIFTR